MTVPWKAVTPQRLPNRPTQLLVAICRAARGGQCVRLCWEQRCSQSCCWPGPCWQCFLWMPNPPAGSTCTAWFKDLTAQCKYLPMYFLMIYGDFKHKFASHFRNSSNILFPVVIFWKHPMLPTTFLYPFLREDTKEPVGPSLSKCQQLTVLNTEWSLMNSIFILKHFSVCSDHNKHTVL